MAGTPQFRFTIFNTDLYPDGVVVNIPVGWKEAKISLERHKDFHSLIEYFAGDFLWYGKAREVLTEIENDQGIDAKVRLLIEIRYRNTWEELFNGQIDLSQLEDYAKANTFYKTKAPIIRDDFWSKFINRMKTPVDLSSTVDLDGGTRFVPAKISLPMPSQNLRSLFRGEEGSGSAIYQNDIDEDDYIQVGFDSHTISEIEYIFTLPTSPNPVRPANNFEARHSGKYVFNIRIEASIKNFIGFPVGDCSSPIFITDPTSDYVHFYIQKNNEPTILLSETDIIGQSTVYDASESFDLSVGDVVRVYGIMYSDTWNISNSVDHILIWGNDNSDVFITTASFAPTGVGGACEIDDVSYTTRNFGTAPSGEPIPTFLSIVADTVFEQTETDAFLIKDASESIVSKLLGADNVIQSSLFETNSRLIALMKGKHVRGYSFTDKEFFLSFEEWWNGANPLLNLGLGYVDGENLIEIENKAAFYDNDFTVTFDNVPDMVRSYDLEKFFKMVGTGFKKWSAESESGIDDPQTKGKRRSRFSNFGQAETMESDYYMASLGIEQTRRNRVELGKDWKLDEDTMAIGLKEDGGGYLPEVGADFEGTTGLLNPDERINIRYTPRTIFERWKNYVMGGLQKYLTDSWIFTSGEGNYSMSNEYPVSDWEFPGLTLTENENVPVTQDYLWIPEIYKAKVPMSWDKYKAIKANRKKAIGISATTSGHRPYHIINLDFQMMAGSAEITVILGNELTVSS